MILSGCSTGTVIQTDTSYNKIEPLSGENGSNVKQNNAKDNFYQLGIASWYGDKFNGRRTSNGEIYDMYKLTAAHKELPFNTLVEVENLKNRKKVIVRINDRGPFVKDRIIDLSYKAAISIDMDEVGTTPVLLRIVDLIKGENGRKVLIKKIDFTHKSEFFIQAGAFSIRENAIELLDGINKINSGKSFSILNENGYFKVISEKIGSRYLAENLKRVLEEQGFDTFIKEVFITTEN